jgi:hypothetical protein
MQVITLGETSASPDMTDLATDTIKEKLKDMIFPTSVTIVVISPNMKKSDWMEGEIKYSLRTQTRGLRTSRPNGIVCVVQKSDEGNCDWARATNGGGWLKSKFFSVLYDNIESGYIKIVAEGTFLDDISKYIEIAAKADKDLIVSKQ